MTAACLPIAAVERETRLSKDVLRVWERRYGFPAPGRDAHGERCYPQEQVERLRLLKRLMDQGLRPGRLMHLSDSELGALLQRPAPGDSAPGAGEQAVIEELLTAVKRDPAGLRQAMRHHLARLGLERFVEGVAAPLTAAVGARWQDGSFDIFDEHLYTETATRILRQAVANLPEAAGRPRILLTSMPGETHGLGLIMAEALLALDGASCIALGTETPPASIARAVASHAADVLALSFSAAYPRRQIVPALQQLRQLLPEGVALWAGGAGAAAIPTVEGVLLLPTLDSGRRALAAWRTSGLSVE
ncbi:MerR family transcriptional regulator [Massilia sp. IC2-476]|uniref:MerR family transcriptional regulator n=1 Tax=Massilia sp. IC2-476 TaxID=2887199 RepID=UPI001D12C5B4|nr:MerR family transcriptional regulator [Massilia sp. IC2-476]MCC2974786.1 MerR family transcriptional regulator [Massilia sp. IC2-476]